MRAWAVAALLAAGCRSILGFDTPVHETGARDAAGDTPRDVAADTRGSDAPPDAVMLCAMPGMRLCVDATHAGVCSNLGMALVDRTCPPESTCSAGHCQPPNGALTCDADRNCAPGLYCDLYDHLGALQGYCTMPLGTGGITAMCTQPGDAPSVCATGICAQHNGKIECLDPCKSGADCPGGVACNVVEQPATIEGDPANAEHFCSN